MRLGLSLFSNCGAGDLGYRKAGFRFKVLAEIDRRRLAIAKLNHRGAKGIVGDIRETWQDVVEAFRDAAPNVRPDLLSACPPCQGLSTANSDRGDQDDAEAGMRDPRNLLVVPIAQVALELQPRILVVENVQAFLTRKVKNPRDGSPISAAQLLISTLAAEYRVFPMVADLADLGVPQTRVRCFLTFVSRDEPCLGWLDTKCAAPYPKPTHASDCGRQAQISLQSALCSFELPSLDAKSLETAGGARQSHLHFVPVWSDRLYAMVEAIPINSGSGAWKNDDCPECGEVEVDERAATCSKCNQPLLRPIMRDESGSYRLVKGFQRSSYRRMSPEIPAATITTASGRVSSDRTLHPWENRVLSPLECALLQTIPIGFKWGAALADYGVMAVREMIGEAVPPRFTELHGRVLISLLDGKKTRNLLPRDDPRCRKARIKLDRQSRSSSHCAQVSES